MGIFLYSLKGKVCIKLPKSTRNVTIADTYCFRLIAALVWLPLATACCFSKMCICVIIKLFNSFALGIASHG